MRTYTGHFTSKPSWDLTHDRKVGPFHLLFYRRPHTRWMTKRTHTEAVWVASWSLAAPTVAKASLATDSVKGLQWLRLRKTCKRSPCITPPMHRHAASSAASHELKSHPCCNKQLLQWLSSTSADSIERVARGCATERPHLPVPLIAACLPRLRHTACFLSC